MRTITIYLIPFVIAIIASLPSCENQAEINKRIEDSKERAELEKAEYARRDTLYPYEWDQLEINQRSEHTKRMNTYKFIFHEEYIDFNGTIFEGHWTSKHRFEIDRDSSWYILVTQNTIQLVRNKTMLSLTNND